MHSVAHALPSAHHCHLPLQMTGVHLQNRGTGAKDTGCFRSPFFRFHGLCHPTSKEPGKHTLLLMLPHMYNSHTWYNLMICG